MDGEGETRPADGLVVMPVVGRMRCDRRQDEGGPGETDGHRAGLVHGDSFRIPPGGRDQAPGLGASPVFRPYLRWNRSTRPSVSISFCRPVKSGWHLEQISTRCTGTVERVCTISPQAQVIMAGPYWG